MTNIVPSDEQADIYNCTAMSDEELRATVSKNLLPNGDVNVESKLATDKVRSAEKFSKSHANRHPAVPPLDFGDDRDTWDSDTDTQQDDVVNDAELAHARSATFDSQPRPDSTSPERHQTLNGCDESEELAEHQEFIQISSHSSNDNIIRSPELEAVDVKSVTSPASTVLSTSSSAPVNRKYPRHLVSSVFDKTPLGPRTTGKRFVSVDVFVEPDVPYVQRRHRRLSDEGRANEEDSMRICHRYHSSMVTAEEPYRQIRKMVTHRDSSMHDVMNHGSVSSAPTTPRRCGMGRDSMYDVMHHGVVRHSAHSSPRHHIDTNSNVHGGSRFPPFCRLHGGPLADDTENCLACKNSADVNTHRLRKWENNSQETLFGSPQGTHPSKPRLEDTQSNLFGEEATNGRQVTSEPLFGSSRRSSPRFSYPSTSIGENDARQTVGSSRRHASGMESHGQHAAGLLTDRNILNENTTEYLFGEPPALRTSLRSGYEVKDGISHHLNPHLPFKESWMARRRTLSSWDTVNTITGMALPYREPDERQRLKDIWVNDRVKDLTGVTSTTSATREEDSDIERSCMDA